MAKKYIRRCSISSVIREMSIKTIRYQVTARQTITSVGRDVRTRNLPHSLLVGRTMVRPFWKAMLQFLKMLNVKLP